jgi:hypothetical protein
VAQESSSVCECMQVLLLRRELWRGRKEVRDFFDAFREVVFRLLSLTIAVGFGAVEELGVNVQEGVVLLVLGCSKLLGYIL